MKINKKNIIPIDYDEMRRRFAKKGISLRQVANDLGWDGGYLNKDKVEGRGGVRTMDAKYIAGVLGCKIEDLMPKQELKAPGTAKTRAADLTNEELIQELMRRLLKK